MPACRAARLLVVTLAVMLAGSLPARAQGEPEIVLKLGNVQAPGMPIQSGLRQLSQLVRERTGGAVEIQIYPAAQLGSEQEMLEGVQLGTVDMFEGSAGSVGRFLPQLEAFACPFLWQSTESMLKAVRGPVFDELQRELLAQRGMRILDMGWVFGVRHLTTRSTPVRTPADMKGLKVRVQPDAIYLATVRAMGGNPTPIDANELYTALQTGVVDGQENPVSNIWNRKFQEVQKYLVLTGHITQNQVVLIGEASWQRLSAEQQAVLTLAAREAGDAQNRLVAEAEAKDRKKLEEGGMTVIEPDVAAFRAAAADACRDPAIERKIGAGFLDRLESAQR